MRTIAVNFLHFVAPIAVEFISIAFASVFVLAGFPILFYLLAVLILICLVRVKKLGRLFRLILAVPYGAVIIFSLNGISVLGLFLFNANKPLFLLYVLLVCLSGFVLFKVKVLNLRWYHGFLFSAVFILAGLSFYLSQFSLPKELLGSDASTEGAEIVIDYQIIFWNVKDSITPRYLELDPEGKTLFICNRLNAPHTYASLLVYDIESKSTYMADLLGLPAMGIKFDQFTDSLAVVAYEEALARQTRYERRAALFWVNRKGTIEQYVPLHQRLAIYAHIHPAAGELNVLFNGFKITYDRQTGGVFKRQVPVLTLMTGITNFLAFQDRVVICTGGPILNMLLTPGLYLLDQRMTHVVKSHRLLAGTYVLGYDSKKGEIYTNSQWSGTLRVYDKDLNFLRKIKIGGVIRAIAIDSERRMGYVADYVCGDITAFNLDTGERLGSISIGKSARALKLARNGDLFAGSMSGVFRIPLSAWVDKS